MSSRRAFTLLEVLMATVLATVLMIGVLAVVTTLGAPARASKGAAAPPANGAAAPSLDDASIDALVGLLRKDIGHATRVDASRPNELTLLGYDALDSGARERTQRPVRVLYRIEEIDGRCWLIRRQAALDVLTNRNVQRDLVCEGLVRFEMAQSTAATGGKPDVIPPEEAMATWRQGAGAEPGAKTEAAAGPKPDTATAANSDGVTAGTPAGEGKEEMVLYHGLYFYIKYVPWLRKKSSEAVNPADGATPPPTVPGDAAGVATDVARPGVSGGVAREADASRAGTGDLVRHEAITWRLRAWSVDQAGPAFDRIVTTK